MMLPNWPPSYVATYLPKPHAESRLMEAMNVSSSEFRTVWWEPMAGVCSIDQRALPLQMETIRCATVAETAAAMSTMVVRGAPAIGCTAAYGMAHGGLPELSNPAGCIDRRATVGQGHP